MTLEDVMTETALAPRHWSASFVGCWLCQVAGRPRFLADPNDLRCVNGAWTCPEHHTKTILALVRGHAAESTVLRVRKG